MCDCRTKDEQETDEKSKYFVGVIWYRVLLEILRVVTPVNCNQLNWRSGKRQKFLKHARWG